MLSGRVYTVVIGAKGQVIRHELREESSGERNQFLGGMVETGCFSWCGGQP